MKVFGWITTGPRAALPSTRRPHPRKAARALSPRLEALESIELMSRMPGLVHAARAPKVTAEVVPFTANTITINSAHALTTTQTTVLQTATVPDTLTNFTQSFAPPLQLFNPALGKLVAVHINATATLNSVIASENTSTTSPADIQGFTNGDFSITGLGAPISAHPSAVTAVFHASTFDGTINFQPPSGVTFPELTATTTTPPITITDPFQLASFIATPGHTTLVPTLTANAKSGANAPNGNLVTQVRTSASGAVTISYEYIPQAPDVTKLVRFGIHHQPTVLQLTFNGPLNPIDASNAANYVVVAPNHRGSFVGRGTRTIPVTSAVYDPMANTVTLTTARRLNVHQLFQLRITYPSNNNNPIVIEFGGKKSLGGFWFHGQHFVVVNGRPYPG